MADALERSSGANRSRRRLTIDSQRCAAGSCAGLPVERDFLEALLGQNFVRATG